MMDEYSKDQVEELTGYIQAYREDFAKSLMPIVDKIRDLKDELRKVESHHKKTLAESGLSQIITGVEDDILQETIELLEVALVNDLGTVVYKLTKEEYTPNYPELFDYFEGK